MLPTFEFLWGNYDPLTLVIAIGVPLMMMVFLTKEKKKK